MFRGVAAAAVAAACPYRRARAQGFLAYLAPEEPIEKTLQRLFGSRPIKDGSHLVTLDLPLIAEDGGNVAMSVVVKSPMTPQGHVKAIYVLSEKNPRPLNAKFDLTPACGRVAGSITRGLVARVRALVIHPNERVERKDGNSVERSYRFVTRVVVNYPGRDIAEFDTATSIGENPSFGFAFRVTEPGRLKVAFFDTHGARFEGAAEVKPA